MMRPEQLEEISSQLSELKRDLSALLAFIRRDAIDRDDRDRDILRLLLGTHVPIAHDIALATDHPVARDSADHRYPRGTLNDNTRHARFVRACERIFRRKINHLDLGCAGGGLVWDFLLNGHLSVGIEGSDQSRIEERAEWRTIPSHLFTADITKPFKLSRNGTPLEFDVITAWEVLEHIPEQSLAGLIDNIRVHLAADGIFVCSVATFEDADPVTGATWHVTVKPREWWVQAIESAGLQISETPFEHGDYVRGSGNPRADDWDSEKSPQLGFHLVARKPRT